MTTRNGIASDKAQPVFVPPQGSAWLFPGNVMHARMKPKAHRFDYKVFCLLIDLGDLEAANRLSRLFSVGAFNLLSFRESDHGLQDKTAARGHLRAHIDDLLRPTGIDASGGRVLLLCYPRLLGFAFNPISVYFVYGQDEECLALIYEVRNTFGEMHTYVCPVEADQISIAGIRQERDKRFYVSPFMGQTMRYHFRMLPPGDKVNVRILETDREGPILSATFTGVRRPLTSAAILKACFIMPLMTLKVVAGIHWEAAKLWFKGIDVYNRPAPPAAVSYGDTPSAPSSGKTHD